MAAEESSIPARCGPRCRDWLPAPDAARCPQHRYLDHESTRIIANWLADHDSSGAFVSWMRTRARAETDPHIQSRFNRRPQQTSDRGAGRWDSRPENTVPLYNRFLKYAIDIDNGVGLIGHAIDVVRRRGSCRFLDIGFAPGGMSQLLLDADPGITGVGITLAPESGGNVFPDSFRRHERYSVLERDAIELALDGLPGDGDAFDIVICGITISGSQNDESEHGQLKDRLHLAQLLLALRYLRPGGGILTRMHLSIRPLEIQMLALLTDLAAGRAAYKPLTEFAIRKTFWMVFGGIRNDNIGSLLQRLDGLLRSRSNSGLNALAGGPENPSSDQFGDGIGAPDLMNEGDLCPTAGEPTDLEYADLLGIDPTEIMRKVGDRIIDDMRPIWLSQAQVLEWVMSGRQEKLCGRCRRGSPYLCRACIANVHPRVKEAAKLVEERIHTGTTPILR